MRRRVPNPQRVKIHRSYDVAEIARLLGVHRNTVRNWLKQGLLAIDYHQPTVVLGRELRRYLEVRRTKAKETCLPGHFFCVRCRAPKPPALQMADYIPFTEVTGNLRGICPECGGLIHRRVALAKIDAVCGNLDVQFPQAHPHISERTTPTVNCDFEGRASPDENAQPRK